jgi:hypothetical protein
MPSAITLVLVRSGTRAVIAAQSFHRALYRILRLAVFFCPFTQTSGVRAMLGFKFVCHLLKTLHFRSTRNQRGSTHSNHLSPCVGPHPSAVYVAVHLPLDQAVRVMLN